MVRVPRAILLSTVLLLAGCGLVRTGYTPSTVTVREGVAKAGSAPAAGDSITVVTWNIQYGEDVAGALAEIRAHERMVRCDILLLQEMDPGGVRLLADSLGFHFVYGPAAVHPHHKELFGNAVLSRWPIVSHRAVVLPHEALLTGHRRIAVAADVDLGGRILRAVSVHTATMVMDQDKRLEQAEAVRDSLGAFAGPVVLGGDFNTVSDYEVTLLRRVMRRGDLKAVRLPEGPTIANTLRKLPGSESVLDHIFVKDLAAGSRGVVREARASDHFPVWAVLAPPPGRAAE